MTDAVVVGSGPNGLTAAAVLARAGLGVTVYEAADEIGGGTRTVELFESGVMHDICSAAHPFGAASPIFDELDLTAHGVTWRHAPVELAHPLDGGRSGVLHRSLTDTTSAMGVDGATWRSIFGPFVDRFEHVVGEVLGPILHVPRHPVTLARFGMQALRSAEGAVGRFATDEVRGLYAGIAAHSIQPLHRPTTAAAAVLFVGAAHTVGWPVAEGGSATIAHALAEVVRAHGGVIETGVRVAHLDDLPPHRIAMLDVSPTAALGIAGHVMPGHVRRAYRRWRYGPGAHKVDLVVDGAIPWAVPACARAATVHCGGTFEDIAAAEADLHRGRMPERPFVLVGQQHVADPSRSSGAHHPVWAYGHVPHAHRGDATDAVLDQIERFAPGFRDMIVAQASRTPADLAEYNPNYVGGDIATGANDPVQAVFRPRLSLDPYRIADTVYLCSAATPPGAGVHGMGGAHAARRALRRLRDRRTSD